MKFLFYLFLNSFIVIAFLTSCLKNTDVTVGGSIRIKPEYAIPIGSPELELGTYLNTLNGLNPIDTMDLDTLDGFIYENELYEVPQSIEYRQNIPFTLSGNKETDEYITAAMFRTNVVNKIPAEIILQVNLLDASNSIIDSIYSDGPLTIAAAQVNEQGEVTSSTEIWEKDVHFSDDKLGQLTNISSIEIYNKVTIISAEDVLSKYYSDQDLWLQLSVKISTDLKLND